MYNRTGEQRRRAVEGNRIEDYDLDAVLNRFQAAGRRAYDGGRTQDATDFLVAEQIVCVLRGDFLGDDDGDTSRESSLRLAD